MAAFISSQRTEHQVPYVVSCRALGVSESWFYKWRDRPPTRRQRRRAELADAIRAAFDASGGTYGSPRITDELRDIGWRLGENTVAALMACLGLAGRIPKRRRSLTKAGRKPAAPDLVGRKFTAPAPDVTWCGDLTEIVTDEGKLYLATVIDLFSRRLLGYAMSAHHDAEVAKASLQMAAAARCFLRVLLAPQLREVPAPHFTSHFDVSIITPTSSAHSTRPRERPVPSKAETEPGRDRTGGIQGVPRVARDASRRDSVASRPEAGAAAPSGRRSALQEGLNGASGHRCSCGAKGFWS